MNQDIVTVFLSIIIEAIPFILLGVMVSTLLHVFVKTERLTSFLPKNRFLQCLQLSFVGMFFPVCECGNVPVVRKLIQKNIPPSAAISFLLGAPVLNPIVIITTIVAFPDNPEIWWGRILLSLFIATSVGFLFSFAKKEEIAVSSHENHACHHHHSNKWQSFGDNFISEFSTMAGVMVIGAGLAAIMQNIIPREILLTVIENPFLAICSMMLLAFIISICSTTDAFFALAYSHQFSSAALIAFLVFGPMIDIKSLLLMKTIFHTKTLLYLTLLVGGIVLTSTLLLEYISF